MRLCHIINSLIKFLNSNFKPHQILNLLIHFSIFFFKENKTQNFFFKNKKHSNLKHRNLGGVLKCIVLCLSVLTKHTLRIYKVGPHFCRANFWGQRFSRISHSISTNVINCKTQGNQVCPTKRESTFDVVGLVDWKLKEREIET